MNRRDFLKVLGIGGAAAVASKVVGEEVVEAKPKPVELKNEPTCVTPIYTDFTQDANGYKWVQTRGPVPGTRYVDENGIHYVWACNSSDSSAGDVVLGVCCTTAC